MKENNKNKLWFFLLILILIVGAYLRFYNFQSRISLSADSARDAFVALEGTRLLQFPIVGPFTSVAPVVSSPWYWIQLIIAEGVLGTPYAPWILIAIYSFLTIIVMYKIGILLENRWLGLVAAITASLSPQLISDAKALNNHAVIIFFVSVVIYLFLKLLKEGPKTHLAILFGAFVGMTISTHYQAIGIITLPISLLFFGKKYLKTLAIIGISIIIMLLPLLVFELLNHWYNTKNIIRYLTVDQYKIYVAKRWLTYISDYWPSYISFSLGGERIKGLVIMISIGLYFIITIIRKKITAPYLILLISFLIQVVMVRYYRGELYFGYLKFLLPYIFIFTATVIYQISKIKHLKTVSLLIVGLYIYTSIPSALAELQPEALTNEANKLYNQMQSKVGPGPYSLYKCNEAVEPKIEALSLLMYLNNQYDSDGKIMAYHWGCWYPPVVYNDEIISIKTQYDEERAQFLFPHVDYALKDFSIATPSALLKIGWIEVSSASIYQTSARWWMDEQP